MTGFGLIDRIAYKLWLSDCDHDPMLHKSWESSKACYRRLAEVAVEAYESDRA